MWRAITLVNIIDYKHYERVAGEKQKISILTFFGDISSLTYDRILISQKYHDHLRVMKRENINYYILKAINEGEKIACKPTSWSLIKERNQAVFRLCPCHKHIGNLAKRRLTPEWRNAAALQPAMPPRLKKIIKAVWETGDDVAEIEHENLYAATATLRRARGKHAVSRSEAMKANQRQSHRHKAYCRQRKRLMPTYYEKARYFTARRQIWREGGDAMTSAWQSIEKADEAVSIKRKLIRQPYLHKRKYS